MGIPGFFHMITQIINYLLGPLGREMLAFYKANSAIINSLIVLYGLILVLGNTNFSRIKKQALKELQEFSKQDIKKIKWSDLTVSRGGLRIIASPKSWIPRVANANNLEKLLPIKTLITEFLSYKKTNQQSSL